MGGSSKTAIAVAVAEEQRCGAPKAAMEYPTWNANTTDEADDSGLMDLVMARAAVIAAMRMCSPQDLAMQGQRLAASMSVERRKEVAPHLQEPMLVEKHIPTKDKASTDLPCYVHPALTSELCWRDIDNLREQRRDLLLRGLPRRLCTVPGMRKLLDAAGLNEAVESIRPQCAPGRRIGQAILRVKAAGDLKRVAHFFHGWQCGPGMPIAVSFFSRHSKGLMGGGTGVRPRRQQPQPAGLRRNNSSPALVNLNEFDLEDLPEHVPSNFQRRSTD